MRKLLVKINNYFGKILQCSITNDFWLKSEFIISTWRLTPFEKINGKNKYIFCKILQYSTTNDFWLKSGWIYRSQQQLFGTIEKIKSNNIYIFWKNSSYTALQMISGWNLNLSSQHIVWHHLRKLAVKINTFFGKILQYSTTNDFWLKSGWIYRSQQQLFGTIEKIKSNNIYIFWKNSSHTASQMISGWNLNFSYLTCRLTPFEKIRSNNIYILWKNSSSITADFWVKSEFFEINMSFDTIWEN